MDKICVLLNDKKLNYGNIRVLQNEVRKVGYSYCERREAITTLASLHFTSFHMANATPRLRYDIV